MLPVWCVAASITVKRWFFCTTILPAEQPFFFQTESTKFIPNQQVNLFHKMLRHKTTKEISTNKPEYARVWYVWELSHQFISKQIAFWLLIANMQINLFDGYHKNLNKQIPHPFTDQLRVGKGWAGQAGWVRPAANECFVVWKKWRHC